MLEYAGKHSTCCKDEREKEEKRNEYATWPIRIQNVNTRVGEVGLGGGFALQKKKK